MMWAAEPHAKQETVIREVSGGEEEQIVQEGLYQKVPHQWVNAGFFRSLVGDFLGFGFGGVFGFCEAVSLGVEGFFRMGCFLVLFG